MKKSASSRFFLTTTLLAALAAAATESLAARMPKLDSFAFDFKYEMEALPAAEDLDNDGAPDFASRVYGNSTLSTGGYGYAIVDTRPNGGGYAYLQSANGSAGVWDRYGVTAATGFTVEARISVRDHPSGQYAICLAASIPDSGSEAFLGFQVGNDGVLYVWWGGTSLTNMVNTTDFHTWRIARAANSTTYSVWCDGILVGENLGSAGQYGWGLLLGCASSAWKGASHVSHLRFTKGGYAPMVEGRNSADFEHKYEMDAADARLSATASTSDWTLAGGANGTAALSDGTLFAYVPQGTTRFWMSGPLDSAIADSSPFTLEAKLRVHDSWYNDGKVLMFRAGTPREYCYLLIGKNDVRWMDSGNVEHIVHEGDNSDKMHVFRIAFTGDGDTGVGGFTLWRDGEMVSDAIKAFETGSGGNCALLGVGSRAYGGSFDVDYIRWTTAGVFAPYVPPHGTVVSLY